MAALDRRIASLSGSTSDADIAELRKLQAERREAQENLDDSYYQHSMDAQGKALDDESRMFRETREDYLETLRETLEDTTTIIQAKITELLANADVVLNGLNTTSQEYGITLSDSLMAPWISASETALSFKNSLDENLPLLINEDGVVTVFGTTTQQILEDAFGAGSAACTSFKNTVQADIASIRAVVKNSTSPLTANLQFPWEDTTKEDGPISTFSQDVRDALNTALRDAKNKANEMKNSLTSPWTTAAVNTWSTRVGEVLSEAQRKAAEAGRKISASLNITVPSYTSGSDESGSDNDDSGGNRNGGKVTQVKKYTITGYLHALGLRASAVGTSSNDPEALRKIEASLATQFRDYYKKEKGYTDEQIQNLWFKSWKSRISYASSAPYYAKGTMGTKQDGFAITDESWIGEEITLAAGKNGQLQYLKKGSAVMPADISANLVEWGKLNPNMMDMSNAVQGVNLMSNYVNKPEIKLDIENLLKVERVDKDTLPDLEKLMDKKLDNFARQLNYSIKKFK